MTSRSGGFTTIELLLAATITVAIAGILLAVTLMTLGIWRRSQDFFSVSSQAKIVLDYLERDLQTAVYPGPNGIPFAVDLNFAVGDHGWRTSTVMKPVALDGLGLVDGELSWDAAKFGRTGAWLRFFCSDSPTTETPTLPMAVSYQIVRRTITGASTAAVAYSLYRSVEESGSNFTRGFDISKYDDVFSSPPIDDVLATNVIDFGIRFFARDESGNLVRIFPNTASDPQFRSNSSAAFPDIAEVAVRILTDEGASIISAFESGVITAPEGFDQNTWWWSVALNHSRVFSRRIEIQAKAP